MAKNDVFTKDQFKQMVDAIAAYGDEMNKKFKELDQSFGKEDFENLRKDFDTLTKDQREFWKKIFTQPAAEKHDDDVPPEFDDADVPPVLDDDDVPPEFDDDDIPPETDDFDEYDKEENVFREPAEKPSEKIFRGRCKDGKWVEGDLVRIPPKTEIVVQGEKGSVFFYEVEPESVAQSTGLHDFDGKLVFDRDILQARDDTYRVVRYIDRLGGYVLTSPGTPEIVEPGISGLEDYRVAGNMFEGLGEEHGSLWN